MTIIILTRVFLKLFVLYDISNGASDLEQATSRNQSRVQRAPPVPPPQVWLLRLLLYAESRFQFLNDYMTIYTTIWWWLALKDVLLDSFHCICVWSVVSTVSALIVMQYLCLWSSLQYGTRYNMFMHSYF